MVGDAFPFKEICKRDGRVVPFDPLKITQAIFKAAKAVGGEDYALAKELTGEVIAYLQGQQIAGLIPTVEEIQDAVEKILIERGHARTAKAYILYRAKRTRIREAKSELMDVVKDILLFEGDRGQDEHSQYSPAGKMHQIALAASQKYYFDNLLPAEIAAAHQLGSFHIHCPGYYSKTLDSLQLDLFPVLKKGFDLHEKAPPGDFLAMLWRVALLLQKNQHDLFGEQALPFFDCVLARLWRTFKIKASKKELRAGIYTFIDFLGALSYTGGNALRCSIQLGLDQTPEGREIAGIILDGIMARKEKSGAWPKYIFVLQKGINFSNGDPNYDLYKQALRAAIAVGSPSFLVCNVPHSAPGSPDPAGPCSFGNGLRVSGNRCGPEGGKKRGNIASLTINLPRLALSTRADDLFFVELDRLLRLGVRQLLHRFEVLTSLQCKDLPFLMGNKLYQGSESLAPWESIQESLKNGLLTFNIAGLPETLRVLAGTGQKKEQAAVGMAVEVLRHLSRRVRSFAEEYELNIALCGVETEDKLSRFVEKDRHEFGMVSGVTDKDFYNSNFILFQEDAGLADKIALEAAIHQHCSAGHESRVILLSGMEAEGAEEMVRGLVEAGIDYLSLNTLC